MGDTSENKSILIVDDDPAYAKMVREWIRDQYNVNIVTAGRWLMHLTRNYVIKNSRTLCG